MENYSVFEGDCRNVIPTLKANSVDLILTDPPYGIDGMGAEWDEAKLRKKEAKAGAIGGLPVGMKFDKMQGVRLQEFLTGVFRKCFPVIKPGGFLLVFSQSRLTHRVGVACEDAGFEVKDTAIWHQPGGGQGKAFGMNHFIKKMAIPDQEKERIIDAIGGRKTPQLRPMFETILVAQKPKEGTFVQNWMKYKTGLIDLAIDPARQQTTVFACAKPKSRAVFDHMTLKPIPLLENLIKVFSIKGQVVLDPFAGSGSTLRAAVNTGRDAIGIEREPQFLKLIEKRMK
jgi:DNA modification methylase